MLAKRLLTTASHIPEMAIHPVPVVLPKDGFYLPQKTACAARRRHAIPSVWMRAGTSKGLFIHRHHLPPAESEWAPILLSAMGSRNGDKRQLDGIGGATSTTSKVAVVSKSNRPGVDVDYTFAQVAPSEACVDMSGNCGNIASGVGPFALDEGLVKAAPGQTHVEVRIFNTNTNRLIVERLQVDADGYFREDGDYHIAGVAGTGSCIRVSFVSPGGAMTGKLFPSGQRIDTLKIPSSDTTAVEVRATLLDAANPFIFVDSDSLPTWFHELDPNDPKVLEFVELARRGGAVRFGLAENTEAAARTRGTPKIAILSKPRARLSDIFDEQAPDIEVQAYSMGKAHPSFQLTGTVCLAAALKLEGTVAWNLSRQSRPATPPHTPKTEDNGDLASDALRKSVIIKHRSGQVEAEVVSNSKDGEEGIDCVSVFRTARRLFEGNVFV